MTYKEGLIIFGGIIFTMVVLEEMWGVPKGKKGIELGFYIFT